MKKTNGKWIMVITKLPTEVAPPAMSIHWAEPWPITQPKKLEVNFKKQAAVLREVLRQYCNIDSQLLSETDDYDLWDFLENEEIYDFVSNYDDTLLDRLPEDYFFRGIDFERNQNAVKIKWNGEEIRVFPEEFSEISVENMKVYTQVFTFHENNTWNDLSNIPRDPDERFIFEAALLDGCDAYQANNILVGGTAESINDFPPPIGWYECPMEYGLYFHSEEDLKPRMKRSI